MKITGTTIAIGLCVMLSACHSPRGGAFPHSFGSSTYYSTETRQTTITIVDVRTDEELFVMDVPPGKQLSFDFVAGRGDDPVHTPDLMRWQIFDMGTSVGRLRNSLTVPAASSRRIDVDVRQGVQYAEAPPEERLRTDQASDRPDWWSPRGGPMPDDGPAEMYDR